MNNNSSDQNHQTNEERRLLDALRNLPRKRAPWYFEARLTQELQRKPRGVFGGVPLPAYAFTGLAVLLLSAAVVYLVDVQQIADPGPAEEVALSAPDQPASEEVVMPEPQVPPGVPKSKAVAAFNDSTPLDPTLLGDSSGRTVMRFEFPAQSGGASRPGDALLQTVGLQRSGRQNVHDSILRREARRDSLDSLSSRKDTTR